MKIKNLLLALLALPLMMVACEPDTPVDEVKDPTVAVTAGTATENSISFTVTSTDADEVAYLVDFASGLSVVRLNITVAYFVKTECFYSCDLVLFRTDCALY